MNFHELLGNENYVTNSLLFFEYFEKFKNLYYQLNFQINENIHLYIILQVIEKQLCLFWTINQNKEFIQKLLTKIFR